MITKSHDIDVVQGIFGKKLINYFMKKQMQMFNISSVTKIPSIKTSYVFFETG
jgi:hypothetical protein